MSGGNEDGAGRAPWASRRAMLGAAALLALGGRALAADGPPKDFSLPIRPDWLALGKEAALEPDLPIIDSGHHLWDFPSLRYLLPDLLADFDGHNIRGTVFLESSSMYRADGPELMRSIGEVEFVNGVAAMSASGRFGPSRVAAGIIGYAPIELGASIEPLIEGLIAAGNGRFRSIRGYAYHDPLGVQMGPHGAPAGRLLDPRFREGFARLAAHGLSYDSVTFHHQMMDLTDLADRFPQTPIILNHVGMPLLAGPYATRRKEVMAAWRTAVTALGKRPNVYFKLGGIGIPTIGHEYEKRPRPPTSEELARDFKPFFEPCIEAAGAERCMFESDFPADKISYGYGTFWNACKRLTKGYSESERRALFAGSAKRAYRLDLEI